METLKTSETLIEGLVKCNQNGIGNQVEKTFSDISNLGKENGSIDLCNSGKGFDRAESSSYVDVPIKGISLYVDLIGEVTNKFDKNVGQQEFMVNNGDFVWAILEKVKKQWWPAIVCDASTAPQELANGPTREDDILVRCFGKGNYIWCPPYHIKPFVGYFDELPNQSKAQKYLDALDTAVSEFGHCVRTEFSCSCFSNMPVEKKTGNFGDLLVTRFEPVKFLDYIKDLARDVYMPNKIDYVIKQNCLSAFYSSLGHLQIPVHQLIPENATPVKIKIENEDIGKSEKSYESRERKKSSFLFYPGENGIEKSKVDFSQPVKMPPKKRGRKRKNVTSSEVLSQLHFAAKDCVFPDESKNFDLVEQFITKFRKWVFNDFSSEKEEGQIRQETLPKKVKKKKGKSVISPTLGKNSSTHGSVVIDFQKVSTPTLESQVTANNVIDQNAILNFGNLPVVTGGPMSKLKPIKKKKNAEISTCMPSWSADVGPHLPNVNGYMDPFFVHGFPQKTDQNAVDQNVVLNFGNPPVVTGPLTQLKPIKKKKTAEINTCMPLWNADVGPHLPNMNGYIDPFLAHGLPQKTDLGGFNQPPPFFAGSNGQPHVGPYPTGLNSNHEPKKRGRKQKNTDLTNLNENGTEMKKEKRTKKSIETGGSCIDLSYNKVQQDNEQEVKGTAFLLKFSPDHPLPSTQVLNLVFSKYGVLIESETQILNEKLSGQVVFLDSSSAGGAFWRLQNDQPFGPALVNYRIQHLSAIESRVQYKTPIKSPLPIDSTVKEDLNGKSNEVKVVKISKTVEEIRLPSVLKSPPQHGDLVGIKKNLEMMKLMLEKNGDSLLPEMRVKLESEIKGLMNKVSTMDGSSSSSCCL